MVSSFSSSCPLLISLGLIFFGSILFLFPRLDASALCFYSFGLLANLGVPLSSGHSKSAPASLGNSARALEHRFAAKPPALTLSFICWWRLCPAQNTIAVALSLWYLLRSHPTGHF